MFLCIDADFWTSARSVYEQVHRSSAPPEAYVPGEFYRRELPGTLEALKAAPDVELVVIDGYVWLGTDRPGLGARLFDAIRVPVVGVAKTRFHDNDRAVEVRRGTSTKPVWVTAEGIEPSVAAAHVASMHGAYRLPSMLKRVDRLARDA